MRSHETQMSRRNHNEEEIVLDQIRTYSSSPSSVIFPDTLQCEHERGIKDHYDTEHAFALYGHVTFFGTDNIHCGKWDGIDSDQDGSFGMASEQLTDHMFQKGLDLMGGSSSVIRIVDLGAGTGGAARKLVQDHENLHITCLNLCAKQNEINAEQIASIGLQDRIEVNTGSYEEAPYENSSFDLVFSQDSLIHSFDMRRSYIEAKRICRAGGVFIFCDLMRGECATQEELDSFGENFMVRDCLTPEEHMAYLREIGWKHVNFVDMTSDVKKSFKLMLQKVEGLLGNPQDVLDPVRLEAFKADLVERLEQVDRSVFRWGIIHAKKPVKVAILPELPLPFSPATDLIESFQGQPDEETDSVVVDFTKRIDQAAIEAFPDQLSTIITLSSGADHIDKAFAASRGIQIMHSDGREVIANSVAEYTLSLVISGLRNIYGTIGVPFPGKEWHLGWKCEGVSLDRATIGFIGMGAIAKGLASKLRAISSSCKILYYKNPNTRDFRFETRNRLQYVESIEALAKKDLDILLPLTPLTESTIGLVSEEIIRFLPKKCGIINVSRGKCVDQDALIKALKESRIKYAILDTTHPEPLPEGHELLSMENVHILPHFATNTVEVRQKIINGIEDLLVNRYIIHH